MAIPKPNRLKGFLKFLAVLGLLYIFLVSISLMGAAFKSFGKGFAESLIRTTSNPVVGLFIGLLVTSIIQSSSTTTSMIVGFVAGGVLTIENAIPMIMGANIGTSVTNVIVSLGHITRKEEFKRAFSGALIHDIFNIIVVLILFPLELATGYLKHVATFMANVFQGMGGLKVSSPIKVIVKPAVHFVEGLFHSAFPDKSKLAGILMLVLALLVLFFALFFLVKIIKSLMASKTEVVIYNMLGKSGIRAMILGIVLTVVVQSSSVTTSILVPLLGAGIITIEMALPVTLGANIGTTVTAILASLTGNIQGIIIAFAHLAFNITGILLIYPVKRIRAIPIFLARKIGEKGTQNRIFALVYVVSIFFIIPGLLIFLTTIFK